MAACFTRCILTPTPRQAHGLLLLAAAAILSAALITQYGFGYRPCEMCLWQRWPYVIIIASSLCALVANPRDMRPLLLFAAGVMAASLGLAIYHTGVEHHVFTGPTACTDSITGNQSLEELRNMIKNAEVVSCDTPALRWFAFSMAEWNIVASLLLFLYALRALWVSRNI